MMDSEGKTTNLLTALLEAQRGISGVAKNATNEFAKFKYASGESMISEGRAIFHKFGLVLLIDCVETTDIGNGTFQSVML
jgi:hypothetical protein